VLIILRAVPAGITALAGLRAGSILVIACSPLDAGQTDVMIDRHERLIAHFRDKRLSNIACFTLLLCFVKREIYLHLYRPIV